MTDDTEHAYASKPKPDISKLSRYKNATRWSDERNNPCVKVTLMGTGKMRMCGHADRPTGKLRTKPVDQFCRSLPVSRSAGPHYLYKSNSNSRALFSRYFQKSVS